MSCRASFLKLFVTGNILACHRWHDCPWWLLTCRGALCNLLQSQLDDVCTELGMPAFLVGPMCRFRYCPVLHLCLTCFELN